MTTNEDISENWTAEEEVSLFQALRIVIKALKLFQILLKFFIKLDQVKLGSLDQATFLL